MVAPITIYLDVATELPGYVKVRLHFETVEPHHVMSHDLQAHYEVEGPYFEDISVLIPLREAFNRLSCYEPIFGLLREAGILHGKDILRDFEIRDEDTLTVAYYERRD